MSERAAENDAPRRGNGPCNIHAPHLPHRWDIEDREPLRLLCPGRDVARVTPRVEPLRYADGCVGEHAPGGNPICASHLRALPPSPDPR